MNRYDVLLTPDTEDGGYTVTVPALPGVVTHGDTVEEALEMARDAIAVFLKLPEDAAANCEDRVEAIMATVAVATPAWILPETGKTKAPSQWRRVGATMRTFTVVLIPDHESGGATVTVPSLPGCIADAWTADEALARARDAISLDLSDEDADQFTD